MRAVRAVGWTLLWLSLLGWSAWWVVCNVYEFAPRLSSITWLAAWASALLAVTMRRSHTCLAWLLAAINGLYLLAVHRQLDHGSGIPLYLTILLILAGLWLLQRWRPQR